MEAMETLEGWKQGEVVSYATESYSISYSAAVYVVMNKNKWNSLSPDIKRIIEGINDEWIERQGGRHGAKLKLRERHSCLKEETRFLFCSRRNQNDERRQ